MHRFLSQTLAWEATAAATRRVTTTSCPAGHHVGAVRHLARFMAAAALSTQAPTPPSVSFGLAAPDDVVAVLDVVRGTAAEPDAAIALARSLQQYMSHPSPVG